VHINVQDKEWPDIGGAAEPADDKNLNQQKGKDHGAV
jgi:hypothetical protein